MSKDRHTPTPWVEKTTEQGLTYLTDAQGRELVKVLGLEDGVDNPSRKIEKVANTSFILKAVNSHEELVSALKTAKTFFERNNCGGHAKGHDGKIYIDEGSSYDSVTKALSKAE